jgi:hypothetical protein
MRTVIPIAVTLSVMFGLRSIGNRLYIWVSKEDERIFRATGKRSERMTGLYGWVALIELLRAMALFFFGYALIVSAILYVFGRAPEAVGFIQHLPRGVQIFLLSAVGASSGFILYAFRRYNRRPGGGKNSN